MKNLKLFLLSISLCLPAAALVAQVLADSTKKGYGPVGIFGNLPTWVPIVAGILYELIVRLIPTSHNLSVVDNAANLVNAILPNRKLPADVTTAPGGAVPQGNTFRRKF